jgi:radical SAM protein with 4Fe4S-binding SPASM domain
MKNTIIKLFIKILKYKRVPFITLRMDIINRCNLRCKMCFNAQVDYSNFPLVKFNENDLDNVLKDISPYVKFLMLSCGYEPLLADNFSDIISHIRSKYPHIEIGFCTNGMLLNSAIRKLIVEKNIKRIFVSIDGATKETFENIRIGAEYKTIISNLKALSILKKECNVNFPEIIINTVVMDSNLHELLSIVKIGSLLNADFCDFRNFVDFNNGINNSSELLKNHKSKFNFFREKTIEEAKRHNLNIDISNKFNVPDESFLFQYYLDDFNKVIADKNEKAIINEKSPKNTFKDNLLKNYESLLSQKNPDCYMPFREMRIMPDGKLIPCPCYGKSFGNVHEGINLKKIYFGRDFNKLRSKILKKEANEFCDGCPDQKVKKSVD